MARGGDIDVPKASGGDGEMDALLDTILRDGEGTSFSFIPPQSTHLNPPTHPNPSVTADEEEQGTSLERVKLEWTPTYQRFRATARTFTQQYVSHPPKPPTHHSNPTHRPFPPNPPTHPPIQTKGTPTCTPTDSASCVLC